eukprot:TRINITY_DN102103_c0_g1_i1.p1 TRINITY_DN102103_c0_g1~~TRINITY_DN102103_c0_g1_i1.p1  ORF type:complete len:243 (-),score=22.34 TRINITY_DN102103_c0_g1_i1:453-1148(-)
MTSMPGSSRPRWKRSLLQTPAECTPRAGVVQPPPSLASVLVEVPDFAGRLAEFLWCFMQTARTSEVCVSYSEYLNHGSFGPTARRRLEQHCMGPLDITLIKVPMKEPLFLRLLRTSRSFHNDLLLGVKIRRRYCSGSPGNIFEICGILKAIHPGTWQGARSLQLQPTTQAEEGASFKSMTVARSREKKQRREEVRPIVEARAKNVAAPPRRRERPLPEKRQTGVYVLDAPR